MTSPLKRTVFVLDDDEVVRDSLTALLESRNYETVAFESGRQFLAHPPNGDARCLVLDVHMPDMTGVEVLRELRARGDDIPVILITGRRDPGVEAQATALGASALLDKPLAHKALFAAIEDALTRKVS